MEIKRESQSICGILVSSSLVLISEKYQFSGSDASIDVGDGKLIVNVVPGDYNYDGKLDILLMMQSDKDLSDSVIEQRVYFGTSRETFGIF